MYECSGGYNSKPPAKFNRPRNSKPPRNQGRLENLHDSFKGTVSPD
jgi:hypothetical protein